MNPDTVIFALYTGNDFSGAYGSVYAANRGQEFKSHDVAVEHALAEASQTKPFASAFAGLDPEHDAQAAKVNPVRKFVSDHSAIYGLTRGLAAAISDQRGMSMGENADEHSFEESARQPGRFVFDDDPRFRTVFLDANAYAMGMDLDDARIREGKRITEAVLRSAHSTLRARNIRFLVVLVPTKETVYPLLMKDQRTVPEAYLELVSKEQRLIDEIEAFLRQQGIKFVNATAALRASFAQGLRPYPASDNTHPNANGYRAIAEAIGFDLTQKRR